jgi:hypothetical protein
MVEIVEIFWNASSALQRLGIKFGAGALDPRAERLFESVREGARDAYPGAVPLVRIAVRRGKGGEELRVLRRGQPDPDGMKRLRAVVARALHEVEGADLLPA